MAGVCKRFPSVEHLYLDCVNHLEQLSEQFTGYSRATLSMAGQTQDNYGHHDTKLFKHLEVALQNHPVPCPKNPKHKNFIPVKEFDIDHLPGSFKHQEIVDVIGTLSDRTVLLKVKYTSKARPYRFPDTEEPYPINGEMDRFSDRMATGYMAHVVKYTDNENKNCECIECRSSDDKSTTKVWGEVIIMTACHVVFDDVESRQTSVYFFYDDSEMNFEDVFALHGLDMKASHPQGDWSVLRYATHDMKLVRHLAEMNTRFSRTCHKVSKLLDNTGHGDDNDNDQGNHLTVIVSHPHGFSKQISIGNWTRRLTHSHQRLTSAGESFDGVWARYIYDTPTCPGSSGAPIFIIGKGWPGCRFHFLHSKGVSGNVNESALHWEPLSNYKQDRYPLKNATQNGFETKDSHNDPTRREGKSARKSSRYVNEFYLEAMTGSIAKLQIGDTRKLPSPVDGTYESGSAFSS